MRWSLSLLAPSSSFLFNVKVNHWVCSELVEASVQTEFNEEALPKERKTNVKQFEVNIGNEWVLYLEPGQSKLGLRLVDKLLNLFSFSWFKAKPAALVKEDEWSNSLIVVEVVWLVPVSIWWSLTKKVLNQKWNILSFSNITFGLFFNVTRTSPWRIRGGFKVIRSTPFSFFSSTVGVNRSWLWAAYTVRTGTRIFYFSYEISRNSSNPVHSYLTPRFNLKFYPDYPF